MENESLVSTRTPEDLEKSIRGISFDSMIGNFEQTIFVLDDSASMSSPVNSSPHQDVDGVSSRMSRVEILKRSFVKFLDHKFKKNPLSRVSVVSFSHSADTLLEDSDDVQAAKNCLNRINGRGGSTNLHRGLYTALAIVKKTHRAWVPRIIILSDGECSSEDRLREVFKQFATFRVIIDAIFIKGDNTTDRWEKLLRDLVRRTGGVFENICNESEFDDKFLKVSTRLALPPKQ